MTFSLFYLIIYIIIIIIFTVKLPMLTIIMKLLLLASLIDINEYLIVITESFLYYFID